MLLAPSYKRCIAHAAVTRCCKASVCSSRPSAHPGLPLRPRLVAFGPSRRCWRAKCSGSADQPSGSGDTAVSEAVDTIQQCVKCFMDGQLDQILSYVPDELVDFLVEKNKQNSDATSVFDFASFLQVQANFEQVFRLDTYALRNLVFSAPRSVRVLSSLLLPPDRFVQRCAVTSRFGEECVLTFTLKLQESLQSQYRGVRMCKRWMLHSVVGECDAEDIVNEPMPQASPEAVVAAQLQALRSGNIEGVYVFASPENKAVVGPVEHFATVLSNPMYRPLLNHNGTTTLTRAQVNDSTYIEVVVVEPSASGSAGTTPVAYIWLVTRQKGPGTLQDCWMTDSVQVAKPEA